MAQVPGLIIPPLWGQALQKSLQNQAAITVGTMRELNWHETVFFLLLDVIPDYIQKTFGVDENGNFPEMDKRRSVRIGGNIMDDFDVAVIVYNQSEYHLQEAYDVMDQIKSRVPGATVVMLPVAG